MNEPDDVIAPEDAAYCQFHGPFYSGYTECPTCKMMRLNTEYLNRIDDAK